jgi:hypothetical protein
VILNPGTDQNINEVWQTISTFFSPYSNSLYLLNIFLYCL